MELELLLQSEKQAERSAVFTVLTGRRRVGKTSLISKALEGKNVAYLFVSKDSEAVLCQKFQQTIQEQLDIQVFGQISRFRDLFEVIMKASLQRQFTVCNIKLKHGVAWWQCHVVYFCHVPSTDYEATRIRIVFYLLNDVAKLVYCRTIVGWPRAPLMPIYRTKFAIFIGPFVPYSHSMFLQILHVGVAFNEPE